jgi:hypothetical protein
VDADVRGDPAQWTRQVVVGRAVQRCLLELPFLAGRPVGILELVLDIEQPDPGLDRNREVSAGPDTQARLVLLLHQREVGRGDLAIAACLELVGDLVALVQAVKARTLDVGNVDEGVLVANIGGDEAKAFGGIEELSCAVDQHGRNL